MEYTKHTKFNKFNRLNSSKLRKHNQRLGRFFQSQSSRGNWQIFWTFRFRNPVLVLIVTASCLQPSSPWCSSAIRPSNHCAGGELSSAISAKVPSWTLLVDLVDFERACIRVKYSVFHRFQNMLWTANIRFQWLVTDNLMKPSSKGFSWVFSDRPPKKWSDASASRSLGSDDKEDRCNLIENWNAIWF